MRSKLGDEWLQEYSIAPDLVVDFARPETKTVIEVDGVIHRTPWRATKDRAKDAALKALGWTVFRIWDSDVFSEIRPVAFRRM
jgi:very-short-patch-repair endonuclease